MKQIDMLSCCVLVDQRESLSREMQEQLHSRAQDLMRTRVTRAVTSHRTHEHCDALLACVDMDTSLLLSMSLSTLSV